MEFIIISDSKMKITLSKKELDIYEIDSENFSIGNDAQRHAFKKVLNDACRQSGFDGSYSRLMVQMYPAKKGGCEIFVTRLDKSECDKGSSDAPKAKKKREEKGDSITYTFSEFNHLLSVCRTLSMSGTHIKSSLYRSDSGIYYLVVDGNDFCRDEYTPLSFINEFSKNSSQTPICFLTEYCKLVCEDNAVATIGGL